jgi:hypothetical protein
MYMTDWNVSYQRQFSGNWLFTASYLGNKTTHLWLGLNIDPSIYIPGASTTANLAQRTILYLANPKEGAYYSSLTMTDDGANADYNGLLLSMQHRVSHHFSVLGNFTWSHCISDGDFGGDIAGASYQIPTDRDADRGNCNFDYRRLANVSIIAESPFKGSDWTARLLGNWQISPTLQLQSGGPLTITSGVNNSLAGGDGDRADPVPGVSAYTTAWGPQIQMLNPAAFVQNPIGTYGTLGRDTLTGPGTMTVNASLVRFFRMTERYRLETRFEAFNATNRVNFSAPATSLTSSTFGRITAAGAGRVLQFAVKLHF